MDRTIPDKLIHLARILPQHQRDPTYLFLKQTDRLNFAWSERHENSEVPSLLPASSSIEEALQMARKHWKLHSFRTVHCGFKYTLPERDEHGINALYYQMVASYSSSNGIYFDEEMGFNCTVQFASQEALSIWHQIDSGKKRLHFPPFT